MCEISIAFSGTAGLSSYYGVLFKTDSAYAWNWTTNAWADVSAGFGTYSDFCKVLTEDSVFTGNYSASTSSGSAMDSGNYRVQVYRKTGGSFSRTADPVVGDSCSFYMDGNTCAEYPDAGSAAAANVPAGDFSNEVLFNRIEAMGRRIDDMDARISTVDAKVNGCCRRRN